MVGTHTTDGGFKGPKESIYMDILLGWSRLMAKGRGERYLPAWLENGGERPRRTENCKRVVRSAVLDNFPEFIA